MENDILDTLQDVGYTGPMKDEDLFIKVVEEGPQNAEYRNLIVWICQKLISFVHLDESVNAASDEDVSSFLLEISSLLKELGCPFQSLLEGPVSERFNDKEKRLVLVEYLLSELMAARMAHVNRPDAGPELRIQESETAKDLKKMLISLQFPKPPDNITPGALFGKVEAKVKEVLSHAPAGLQGKPIIDGRLSADQWKTLQLLQNEMLEEYKLRRQLLLTRLDVTLTSFQWSDKLKAYENAMAKFVEIRNTLTAEPNVILADILAARHDLAVIQKTSNSNFRKNTQSSIHKVIIGRVPDRGGRPSEQEAPPPEMPSWQKDRAQGGGVGGGGGGRGGFSRGGGRVQGGWNDGGRQGGDQRWNDRGQQDNRRDDRGGHQDYRRDGRGGYQDRRGGDYQDDRGYRGGQRGRGGGRRGNVY